MAPRAKRQIAADATHHLPRAPARRRISRDPVADLALAIALIAAGGLIHWQIEANATLLAALGRGTSLLPRLVLAAWALSALIYLYRNRGRRILLLTAPAIFAPLLLQLPLLHLCSEGHCV